MSESAADEIWKAAREARIRALYFGDMLSRYTKRKQWVQGLSLGFSSGAVVAAIGETAPGLAPVLAAIVALVNVWSISTNIDQKIVTLAMLANAWETLRIEYGQLWSEWYEDGSAGRFEALQRRANDLGVLAAAGAPWDQKAVGRWERFVDSRFGEGGAACELGNG